MNPRVTFVLCPGFIRESYVTADDLRRLYRLERWTDARIVVRYPGDRRGHRPIGVRLHPDPAGRYEVPSYVPKPKGYRQ